MATNLTAWIKCKNIPRKTQIPKTDLGRNRKSKYIHKLEIFHKEKFRSM